MLSKSNNNGKDSWAFPVKPEGVSMAGGTVSEEIVIYDECGDTLWDRVLSQGDKVINPEQGTDSKAE